MAVFIYHTEKNGKLIKNKIEAKNIQVARLKLNARKIDPVYIKKQSLSTYFSGGGNIKKTSLLFFTRQIAFLLNAGVSLVQALEMTVDTTDDNVLKGILKRAVRDLERGKSFSQALKSYPHIFDGFYVNMVVCAEETGLLDQILNELADYIEKGEKIKSRVKSAMMYPIIVLGISITIISGIILFVVPQFANLYSNSGGQLPALTQALVNLSELMRGSPLVLAGLFFGVPFGIFQYSKTESGKKALSSVVGLIPLFKEIQYKSGLVRFCRSFASLLKAGVNFLDALDISYNISDHPDIQHGIKVSRNYITQGKSFSNGLKKSKAFPPLVYNMAKIGEETGKMEPSFLKMTEYYEDLLDNLIAGLIKMIEPILIVVLGGIIAVIILALYLPVFNMGDIVS